MASNLAIGDRRLGENSIFASFFSTLDFLEISFLVETAAFAPASWADRIATGASVGMLAEDEVGRIALIYAPTVLVSFQAG